MTELELLSCAKPPENQVTSAQATFDGINLQWSHIQSPLFNFTFLNDNDAGVLLGPTQAVDDGHWVFLQPGNHEIHSIGSLHKDIILRQIQMMETGLDASPSSHLHHQS